MREHISRDKKTTTEVSIPSLKHPVRGFGLDSPYTAPRVVPDVQPLNKPPGHHISCISLRPQAKLTVNQPGDIFEQEADTVAQQVMLRLRQPGNSPGIQREQMPEDEEELQMKPLASSITPLVQRQQMPEEEELQMKPLDITTLQRQQAPEDEEELQMSPMVQRQANAEMAAAPDLEASINQARGGGQPLAENIRVPMEQAFGADFSGVKVHTDGQSDQLNRSIQARAFTTGQDVFFGQGEYNPGSRGGQELLAHELTHVVQQSGGAVMRRSLVNSPQQLLASPIQAKLTIGEPGDRYEQEADRVASEVVQRINSSSQPIQCNKGDKDNVSKIKYQTKGTEGWTQDEVQKYLADIAPQDGPIRDFIDNHAKKNAGLCAGWVVLHRNKPEKLIKMWETVSSKILAEDKGGMGRDTEEAVKMYMEAQYHFALDPDNQDFEGPGEEVWERLGDDPVKDSTKKGNKLSVDVKYGEITKTALKLHEKMKGSKKHVFIEIYTASHTAQIEMESGSLKSICETEKAGVMQVGDWTVAEKILTSAFFEAQDPDASQNLTFEIHTPSKT